ncbi:unnamed protein product, partial [Staurois parvus]
MPPASATSVPHFSATYQCPSELPFSVTQQCHQCHLSVLPISATNSACQCHLSVPVSAAYQCHTVSAAFQCPSE